MRTIYDQNPMSPSQIAKLMGMTKGAITKLADRLIEKKLIVRKEDSKDGRGQTLLLTAIGDHLVPELASIADQNDAECFKHLSEKDRRFLLNILEATVKELGINSVVIN